MVKNFDFTFAGEKEDVGMKTGATIHTMNGLYMTIQESDPTQDTISSTSTGSTSSWWELQHQRKAATTTSSSSSSRSSSDSMATSC
jgi:hypothetical protein